MKILLIDDHPMVLDFYENMLARDFSRNYPQVIDRGGTCEDAYKFIIAASDKNEHYDLAILDYSLPSYHEFKTGADIANLLKPEGHHSKVIIITSHVEMLLVYDIIKKVSPNGIAIKSDVNSASFQLMVESVLKGENYQSPLIKNFVADIWKKKILADESNRQILIHLAQGYKIKDLENVTHLKSRAIERRINEIRNLFRAEDNSSLLTAARKEGFI